MLAACGVLYHSTKERRKVIRKERREDLYSDICGIHKELKCRLYRIGGIEDHVHILVTLHPTVSLASYVEKVKSGSTNWIKKEKVYPDWEWWQSGYAAFSKSWEQKETVVNYIANQEAHHRHVSFMDEYRELMDLGGIPFDEKYL